MLWAWTDKGPLQVRDDRLVSQVDEANWVRCSAGNGAKGPRVYEWATVEIRPLRENGEGPLAAGQAQHRQAGGVGLLRVLRSCGHNPGGIGDGGQGPLVHRGML